MPDKPSPAPPFSIGSDVLPGLSKLIEEAGEVIQVAGKIIAMGEMGEHFDGSNLKVRLENELGDLIAAIEFTKEVNYLDWPRIQERSFMKIRRFRSWHKTQGKKKGK